MNFNFKNKTSMKGSIKAKLISTLICICILPLILEGTFAYTRTNSILKSKLEITSQQTLTEVDHGITTYFTSLETVVNTLSKNINLIELEDRPEYLQFTQKVLEDTQTSNKDIYSVYYGTESRKMITAPIEDMGNDYDPTSRPWYKLAVENKGKAVITPAYLDAQSKKSIVSIAKAVEKNGKIVGVVAIDIDLHTLTSNISKSKIGSEGFIYIALNSGELIAYPDTSLIGTKTPTTFSIWNDISKNNSGFGEFVNKKEKNFAVYTTNEMTGWKVIANLPITELTKDTTVIRNILVVLVLIISAITSFVATMLSKWIIGNVKKLKEVFSKASEGDLSSKIEIHSTDEFGDLANSFNKMVSNISLMIGNIQKSSEIVLDTAMNLTAMSEEATTSIGEVSRAIEEVSNGATKQAEYAQDGASSINELSDNLDRVTNANIEMVEYSQNTSKLTNKGLEMVQKLTEKSNDTKGSAMKVSKIVTEMNESTNQINAISDTISQITTQTNLLSLNASIEAARAGEAGRGFAVVAQEIRKLAEQSKASTEEIKLIVDSIKEKSKSAVSAMEVTDKVVEEQVIVVNETQEVFKDIMSAVNGLIIKISEIKDYAIVIDNKKTEVVSQIENISSVSEETASASEEVTASTEAITATMEEFTKYAEELQNLSENLQNEIRKFVV